MNTIQRGALGMAALALVAGCAGQQPTKTVPAPTTSDAGAPLAEAAVASAEALASQEATSAAAAASDSVDQVGGPGFTYEDGMQVTVPKLTKTRLQSFAAGGTHGQPVIVVHVTIFNGTSEVFDPSGDTISVTAGEAGNQEDQVFQDGLNDFSGSIAPGHKASATFGFSVAKSDLSKIDISVAPGFDYQDSIFEGSL